MVFEFGMGCVLQKLNYKNW